MNSNDNKDKEEKVILKSISNQTNASQEVKNYNFLEKVKKILKNKYFWCIFIAIIFFITITIASIFIFNKKYYELNYDTNGGNEISTIKVLKGDEIGSLVTPYKMGYIFDGWYYESDFVTQAKKDDKVTSNLCLYAKYIEETSTDDVETLRFATKTDVLTNFSIELVCENEVTQNFVENNIIAINTSNPEIENVISIAGANKNFQITGAGGEFREGSTYKITLKDDSLSFSGYPNSVREFSFTTKQEEVLNAKTASDIKYIKIANVSNIIKNDEEVQSLSVALLSTDDVSPSEMVKGSFTYTEAVLNVGDKVAIYQGQRPDERTLESTDDQNGDIAYLIITEKNGTTYKYKGASSEEIIFKPDILPIATNCDLDGSARNNSITVENYNVDYSQDMFATIGLDSTTTIDVGDFILFYDGVFGISSTVVSYAQILAVSVAQGRHIINYSPCTLDTITKAMDIYTSQPIDGDEMLEGVDQAELLSSIKQQALDSGFVDNVGSYLATTAIASKGFGSDVELLASNGLDVSVGLIPNIDAFNAEISTNLKRFEGYSGLRIAFKVGIRITITKVDSNDRVVIDVIGEFEQEVRLSIGVKSEAVWKVWGIFPYIADYSVSVNIDLFDYTGVDFSATIITQQMNSFGLYDDVNDYQDISEQMRDYINNPSGRNGQTLAEELSDTYADMLQEDTDWATLVEKKLFGKEYHVPPALPIIAANIELNFVVKMDAAVSTGFGFH